MLLAQFDHLLLYAGVCPTSMLGRSTGKLLQGRVTACYEARVPGVEGAPTDMCGATCAFHVAGRFPRFEQQPTLLRRGERKMNSFGHTKTW